MSTAGMTLAGMQMQRARWETANLARKRAWRAKMSNGQHLVGQRCEWSQEGER